jgi:hypothetical protein
MACPRPPARAYCGHGRGAADYADPDSKLPPRWVVLTISGLVALCLLAVAVALVVLSSVASGPHFND